MDARREILRQWIDSMPKENLWSLMALRKRLTNFYHGDFVFKCRAGIVYMAKVDHTIKEEDDEAENASHDD